MVRPLVISAPGSLMLLGEHAVLHGHPCLVAAIERRVRVSVIPRNDGLVTIASALGEYEGERDQLVDHPSFRFILAALRHLRDAAPGGLDIAVEADMPPTIGFGTSAAVTVAMVGALQMAARGAWSLPDTLEHAHQVIRDVQGRGSGADAAASVYGGVFFYRISKTGIGVVNGAPRPLTALYCGYKTPTADVIRRVEQAWADRTDELSALYTRIGENVERGRIAAAAGDDLAFGRVLDDAHDLMRLLGVSTPELETCAALLRAMPGISGAKISGSGLGDCVVGWGRTGVEASGFEQHHLSTAPGGMRLE